MKPSPSSAFDEYNSFVGLFMTQFAMLESDLRDYLLALSGMSEEQFVILVGFPRTSEVTTKLKKMIALRVFSESARAARATR